MVKLLQKVRVLNAAEAYADAHGEIGVVVQMRQFPDDPLPFISVKLDNGNLIEDLTPSDIEVCQNQS